jgi:hypothetical protein
MHLSQSVIAKVTDEVLKYQCSRPTKGKEDDVVYLSSFRGSGATKRGRYTRVAKGVTTSKLICLFPSSSTTSHTLSLSQCPPTVTPKRALCLTSVHRCSRMHRVVPLSQQARNLTRKRLKLRRGHGRTMLGELSGQCSPYSS